MNPFAVFRSAEEWRAKLAARRSVVTVGNFDGVHVAHQRILQSVRERAAAVSSGSPDRVLAAALTFYPHPTRVLRPDKAPPLLMTIEQRLATIARQGIDAVLVLSFDTALASLSAEEFVRRYLVDTMRVRSVLVGSNFRFGHKQGGDVALLTDLGRKWDFDVAIQPPVVEDGIVVSSTAIRQAVALGAVDEARRLLGYPYTLSGEIQPGTGLGRKVVVPTLNLRTTQELLPANGVYATEVLVEGQTYPAATNVGVRPTFNGAGVTVESHLIDFSRQLDAGPLEVRFWERIRGEHKFSSPQELRDQVLRDVEHAKLYFAGNKTERTDNLQAG